MRNPPHPPPPHCTDDPEQQSEAPTALNGKTKREIQICLSPTATLTQHTQHMWGCACVCACTHTLFSSLKPLNQADQVVMGDVFFFFFQSFTHLEKNTKPNGKERNATLPYIPWYMKLLENRFDIIFRSP